ncbi:MAG: PRC-barrel domain-containing protein [Candidatus Brockarchaeota archaeon]|nr:PRC-barrel domain-containing protein [Candidatus Brockarchaeota archaeon]
MSGKGIPQSKLVGMQVYDPDCLFIGTVKELGIVPGEGGITLYVSTKAGSVVEISWSDVKTIGDIILLSKKVEIPQPAVAPQPVQAAQPVAPNCPKCGKPATWIPQYKRYYCYTCKQYL